jgi:RNA polymerase sigma factor (sigma-70 family)
MSPLHVRRYRAERLLREEFNGLRTRVLSSVRQRLRATSTSLDQGDLEACYAQAWQGLYTATLDGQEIANPAGWLVLVTHRRAIEELRSRGRHHRDRQLASLTAGRQDLDGPSQMETCAANQPDLASDLDDRMRLRQLFEAISGRLDPREREAATLCYLQGLSRAEAATRMGITETHMRKLMEGRGPDRPGVAHKVGTLVQSIRDDHWCEQQGSLMRALAYGILDPDGGRYQLALMHHSQCPACRAYVVSLRGLAAVLPPVFLPWGITAGLLTHARNGIHSGAHLGAVAAGGGRAGGGAGVGGGGGGGGASAGGLQAGRAIGALSASGAAGAGGVAGGGWLIGAGPLTAKLAAGCLLALSIGAGCVALDNGYHPSPRHTSRLAARAHRHAVVVGPTPDADQLDAVAADTAVGASGSSASGAAAPLTPAGKASREFGPEQGDTAGGGGAPAAVSSSARSESGSGSESQAEATARSASSGSSSASADGASTESGAGQPTTGSVSGDSAAADREFSPG